MSTIVFDSHAFVKKLVAVGFTEKQAEVFAKEQVKLIEDGLATKRDLKELEMRVVIKLGAMMVALVGVLVALKIA